MIFFKVINVNLNICMFSLIFFYFHDYKTESCFENYPWWCRNITTTSLTLHGEMYSCGYLLWIPIFQPNLCYKSVPHVPEGGGGHPSSPPHPPTPQAANSVSEPKRKGNWRNGAKNIMKFRWTIYSFQPLLIPGIFRDIFDFRLSSCVIFLRAPNYPNRAIKFVQKWCLHLKLHHWCQR